MKLIIDTTERVLIQRVEGGERVLGLYTKEAFELLTQQWLKVGWDQRYAYTFSWMGRPIIQLPDDMVRTQEAIYRVKPDVIIETGVAHGGSLIYYASLCKAMGEGRVIGIDIEIRRHNREAIESHEMASLITLIEGSSTDQSTVARVKTLVKPSERALVILDSCHTKRHVLDELEAYHEFVARGSYIVATDGIMRDLHDVPRGNSEWLWDNPAAAAAEFARKHPEFVLEQPLWPFNECGLSENVTYWPAAWLRKK
ncbi:MAG: class I SAM-dependent methyltransferase [Pyrinomonadaceae bacterium]|nr:class I SAM-dependent methyltransferase [Pyrinomonadaceae bacterium]